MCNRCVELDEKIAHYQRISLAITDQLTLDGIKEAVEKLKAATTATPSKSYEAAAQLWDSLVRADLGNGARSGTGISPRLINHSAVAPHSEGEAMMNFRDAWANQSFAN